MVRLMIRSISYRPWRRIARPIAIGIAASASGKATQANGASSSIGSTSGSSARAATSSAPAYRNHFSCCRSVPRARRKRTIGAARLTSATTRMPMPKIVSSMGTLASGRIAYGFLSAASASLVGAKANSAVRPARTSPASQATGRHRREGSEPVGNTSRPKIRSPIPGAPSHVPSHATGSIAGSTPGAVIWVNRPYCSPKKPRPVKHETPSRIHPMRLSGRRDATSAPINP